MEKKSHHYVPQFYLKNFSRNKKSVGMYINSYAKFISHASIKEQACKDFLYGKSNDIEDSLMVIETGASNIIKSVIQSLTLPRHNSEDYNLLMLFLLISENRVLRKADSLTHLMTEQSKVIARMYKAHGRLDVSDEIIDELYVSHDIPNLMPIQTAIKTYPVLLDLNSAILISDNDRSFITSDNPVTRYNYMYVARDYQLRGYGLGNMGIQIFYPISPKLCIYVYDGVMYRSKVVNGQNIIIRKGKQIDELNKLFYLNSYDYIFFSENTTKTYIENLINGLNHDNNLENEVVKFGDLNNNLICYQPKFVKRKIHIPFALINPKMMKMPLPQHMAGPIRPYAKQFFDKNE